MKIDEVEIIIRHKGKEVYRHGEKYSNKLEFNMVYSLQEITDRMLHLFRQAGYMKMVNLCLKSKPKEKQEVAKNCSTCVRYDCYASRVSYYGPCSKWTGKR